MNRKEKLSDKELKEDYKFMYSAWFIEWVKAGKKEAVERLERKIDVFHDDSVDSFHSSEDAATVYLERKKEMLEPLSTEEL